MFSIKSNGSPHTKLSFQIVFVFLQSCIFPHCLIYSTWTIQNNKTTHNPRNNIKVLKGTVSVISSDPPWKVGNARFTTLKNLYRFSRLKNSNSDKSYIFSSSIKCASNFYKEPKIKIISLQYFKYWYIYLTWSDLAFNGTVVKSDLPALYGGSLEIIIWFKWRIVKQWNKKR